MTERQRMREMQQHARIVLHRTTHVTQQDERPWPYTPLPPRQLEDVAAAAPALGDRAAQIEASAVAAHPSPRSAFTGLPHEPVERRARLGELAARERRKIPGGQRSAGAPGLDECLRRRRIGVRVVVSMAIGFRCCLNVSGACWRERLRRGGTRTLCLRGAGEPGTGASLPFAMFAPEGRKGDVERRDLIVTMNEERAAGVIDLVARSEIDVPERFDEVRYARGVNSHPGASQDPGEDQQVLRETRHGGEGWAANRAIRDGGSRGRWRGRIVLRPSRRGGFRDPPSL